MRLRWLLTVALLAVLTSSAAARSPRRLPPPQLSLGAAFSSGAHAGRLVLAFHNPSATAIELPIRVRADGLHYDALTVELTSESASHTLRFGGARSQSIQEYVTIAPQGIHLESIDLDPMTRELPPGEYDVTVTWDAQSTTTTTFVPYRCGAYYGHATVNAPSPPAKLPYVLGGLALLSLVVGAALGKRAGAPPARVPHSPL